MAVQYPLYFTNVKTNQDFKNLAFNTCDDIENSLTTNCYQFFKSPCLVYLLLLAHCVEGL